MKAPEWLWKQWSAQLHEFLPQSHGHRSKMLAFFVLGEILAGTTHVPRVAEALLAISPAKSPSSERRLARFLANDRIDVESLWTALLGQFLRFWRDRRLVFVLDGTALDERASVLYLGLLVHSRLLPVSWQVMPVHEHWEQRQWSLIETLLDRVIPYLGAAECTRHGGSRTGGTPARPGVPGPRLAVCAAALQPTHLPTAARSLGRRLDLLRPSRGKARGLGVLSPFLKSAGERGGYRRLGCRLRSTGQGAAR